MTTTADSTGSAARQRALRPRYAGQRGHVESFFLKGNDPAGRRALWLKLTILAPTDGPAVAEAWEICFDRQTGLHRAEKQTVPLRDAVLGRDPFELEVGGCRLSARRAVGALGSERPTRWDLRLEGDAPPLRLLPAEWLYRSRIFPRSKVITPWPTVRLHGELELAGERIAVDGWPGCLGHNWGREHTRRYVWAHCNRFAGHPESWFEGASGKVSIGPITLPYLTVAYLWHRGRAYDFRAARHWWNRSVEVDLYRWRFCLQGADGVVRGVVRASPRDLVGLRYAQPRGDAVACLNSKTADLSLEIQTEPDGPVETLRSEHGAALEIVVPEREDHGVRIYA